MRGKAWGYIWSTLLALLLLLLLRESWHIAVDHILLPDIRNFSLNRLVYYYNPIKNFNIGLYWWFAVGFMVYPLARWLLVRCRIFKKQWFSEIETFSHEFLHWLLAN